MKSRGGGAAAYGAAQLQPLAHDGSTALPRCLSLWRMCWGRLERLQPAARKFEGGRPAQTSGDTTPPVPAAAPRPRPPMRPLLDHQEPPMNHLGAAGETPSTFHSAGRRSGLGCVDIVVTDGASGHKASAARKGLRGRRGGALCFRPRRLPRGQPHRERLLEAEGAPPQSRRTHHPRPLVRHRPHPRPPWP